MSGACWRRGEFGEKIAAFQESPGAARSCANQGLAACAAFQARRIYRCICAVIWLLIFLLGIAAGTLGGIIGFGSTTILMPFLVIALGPKAAVPVMAIAAVLGNLARVVVWYREIAWAAVAAFAVPAAVAAWFGVSTMLALDPVLLELGLGLFFIVMIPARRWMADANLRVSLPALVLAGAVVGFLTGIVANTGPVNTPFFLAHGLLKGGFIGTEAAASLAMFSSKTLAFFAFSALSWQILFFGAIVGSTLMIGARLAKPLMHRIDATRFNWVMDGLLAIAGLAMIVNALLTW